MKFSYKKFKWKIGKSKKFFIYKFFFFFSIFRRNISLIVSASRLFPIIYTIRIPFYNGEKGRTILNLILQFKKVNLENGVYGYHIEVFVVDSLRWIIFPWIYLQNFEIFSLKTIMFGCFAIQSELNRQEK